MAKEMQATTVQSYQMKTIKGPSYLRCDECDKVFTRSWLLKNHHRVHTGERPYKCAYCDKAFADKSNLRQHAKIHTTKEKLFTCAICQKSFAQRRYLMKHASEIHRDISLSLYGEEKSAKISKITSQTKYIIQKPPLKPVTMVLNARGPGVASDQQSVPMLQTKTTPEKEKELEPAAAKISEQKYSEQDLKDFIKSNQKTMEKNGYIFIKQNFETLDTDTEPTLTEMSDIPVTDISDTVKQDIETKDLLGMGNQLLKVNGKMVYLQMDNRTITREELMKGDPNAVTKDAAYVLNGKGSLNQKNRLLTPKTAKKLVAKTNIVKRHTNILKSAQASAKKQSAGIIFGGDLKQPIASVQSMVQNVMKTGNPVQYLTMTQSMDNQPITLLQVPNQHQLSVIPLSIVQLVPSGMEGIQTLSHGQSTILPSNFHNIKITSVPNLGLHSAVSRANNIANAVSRTRAIEMANTMDERGAAGDMGGVTISSMSTPMVSDAPWQGVLNINSEQELLEYINSHSNNGLDTDQGFTILIQNVDPQNNAVLSSLDPHSLLSGSGHMSGMFSDQGGIISDILPGDESNLHTASTEETVISNPVLGSVNQMSHSGDEINVESVVVKSESQDQGHMMSSEEAMKDAGCGDDDGGGRQDFNQESCDDVYKDHGHMMLDQSTGEQYSDSETGQEANEIVFEIKPEDEHGNQQYIVHVNSDIEVDESKTGEMCDESLIDESQVSDSEYVEENDEKDMPTMDAE